MKLNSDRYWGCFLAAVIWLICNAPAAHSQQNDLVYGSTTLLPRPDGSNLSMIYAADGVSAATIWSSDPSSSWRFGYNARQERTLRQTPDATLFDLKSVRFAETGAIEHFLPGNTYRYAANAEINPSTWTYLTDRQGSPRALRSASGTIAPRYDYDSLGQPDSIAETSSAIAAFDLRREGLEFLSGIGVYDNAARFYDSLNGRFLQTDPARRSISPYGSRRGNPANYVDMDGARPDRDMILGITTDRTFRAALFFEASTDVQGVWEDWGIAPKSLLHSHRPYVEYMDRAYRTVTNRRGDIYFYLGDFDFRRFLKEISDIPIALNTPPERVAFSRNLQQLLSEMVFRTTDNKGPQLVRFNREVSFGGWLMSGFYGREFVKEKSYSPSITSVELLDVLSGPHSGLLPSPKFHLIKGDYSEVNKLAFADIYLRFRKHLGGVLANKKLNQQQRMDAMKEPIERFGTALNNLAGIYAKPEAKVDPKLTLNDLRPRGKIGRKYQTRPPAPNDPEARSKL